MVAEIKAGSVHELPQTWGFRDELVPEILEKVRALRPLLRKNAAAGEAQRSPTDEVIEAIDELGIWWMIVPRRWGGLGLSATAMAQINAELAKGDPSVAWVSQILNGTTWVGTLGSDALQEELYGNGRPRISHPGCLRGRFRRHPEHRHHHRSRQRRPQSRGRRRTQGHPGLHR